MPTTDQLVCAASRSPNTIAYPVGTDRLAFDTVKISPLQWRVYDLVKQIPPGSVSTYLATSPQAVGTALKKNPFCPLVPCHRVVATNGQLGGFFGQTKRGQLIDTKARMLREEGIPLDTCAMGWYYIPKDELSGKLWTGAGN